MQNNTCGKINAKQKQNWFLFCILLFPTIQFIIFYLIVNANSLFMSFKTGLGTSEETFVGFVNYTKVWNDIFVTKEVLPLIKNSLLQFLIGYLAGMPIHIIVAYSIFKKIPFSGFFQIMLFLPTMITSMVFVVCGRMIINEVFPIFFGESAYGLLQEGTSEGFWTVLIFGCWHGFAGGLIIYLGAMGSISKDVMEYCKLERISTLKELWYIVIPLIFPTIITYTVVGLSTIFTNYGHYLSFYQERLPEIYQTLGYYFIVKSKQNAASATLYPYLSAMGIMFSLIIAPITMIVKHLMEKYGPSEE